MAWLAADGVIVPKVSKSAAQLRRRIEIRQWINGQPQDKMLGGNESFGVGESGSGQARLGTENVYR